MNQIKFTLCNKPVSIFYKINARLKGYNTLIFNFLKSSSLEIIEVGLY